MWGWGEVVFPCHIPGSALSKYSDVFVYASINIIPLLCPTIWVEIFGSWARVTYYLDIYEFQKTLSATVCATLYFVLLLFTPIQALGMNIAFIRA
jgi:hypothetical protein